MSDRQLGFQDTGNPVLDSTVNIAAGNPALDFDGLRQLHAVVLELAEKEPGGLRATPRQMQTNSKQKMQERRAAKRAEEE